MREESAELFSPSKGKARTVVGGRGTRAFYLGMCVTPDLSMTDRDRTGERRAKIMLLIVDGTERT